MYVCMRELMTAESSNSWIPVLNYSWSNRDRFGLVPVLFPHPCPPFVLSTPLLLDVSYQGGTEGQQVKRLRVVLLFSCVRLFVTTRTAAHQASLSFTVSLSLLKLMSIESMMPSNHLVLCHPLLLLSSIFPSIRVFSNESVLHIRWPKYWSFSILL